MTPTQFRRDLERLQVTQVAFAERIGVNPRTVRRWLAGDIPVPGYVASWLDLYYDELGERHPVG